MTLASSFPKTLDALVVGAGPAGIGTALALGAVDDLLYGVIERSRIAETFLRWPSAIQFLTPSFTGNGFGATDLNSIHPKTSPAFSLGVDYPTGREYARYLTVVAQHFAVPVLAKTGVLSVEPRTGGFLVETSAGVVTTKNLIWAGGEYGNPLRPEFPGSDLAVLYSSKRAWQTDQQQVVIAGGYESGLDIACHLVQHGTRVTVVDPEHPWAAEDAGSDPSFLLAPRTRQRLREAQATGRLTLIAEAAVRGIHKTGAEGFQVELSNGTELESRSQPILATGFGPGLGPVAKLFEEREDGWPLLTEEDESTLHPGLFLSGPAIRHGSLKFCFVYKFRQRFAVVAEIIGNRLGRDTSRLEEWKTAGMYTDDLECCGIECAC